MKKTLLNIMSVSVALLCNAADVFAQQRPKLKELNDKRYEQALNGVSPWEKKGAYGYADEQGKFFIPPVFRSVMPMDMHNVGFVSYFSEYGSNVWTPISLKGVYLTDLEFDKVVKNFDDRGLAVVRQEGKYGVINHIGKMVANCIYTNFADKEQVYLLYSNSGGCVAIAKDKSEKGYSAYSFAAGEPVVVEAEGGYGIISPKNYFVVADFEYDSVRELIPNAAYCLQKDGKKYLYAGEKLSHGYEDVIPGSGKSYFVVKQDGKYGVVSTQNATLLACTQDEMPVLKKGEFSCFNEHGLPVYLTVDRRVTPTEYDNYLFEKHKDSFADYLLETTLDYGSKQYIGKAVAALYGTKDFARVQHLPEAVEYAESRRFILLSKDNENAKFFDLNDGKLLNADEVLYHAFPSKSGAPAYASCLRNGKFGIIDIRNKQEILPFEYDRITPLGKDYVSLHQGSSCYLYNVPDTLFVTSDACSAIDRFSIADLDFICVEQDGMEKLFNPDTHHWILPDTERLDGIVPVLGTDGNLTDLAAVMKKGAKGALYSIRSGERLTDYLFEDVDQELFARKYYVVTVGGKKGLYDLAAKKYVLACLYDEIKDYYKYNGDEFAVVMKAKMCGLHNITKNKLVITMQNDEINVKSGYASIRRGGRYAIQSLKTNQMVFESPVEEVIILLEDGYALLYEGEGKAIYDLSRRQSIEELGWYKDIIETRGDYVAYTNTDGSEYRLLNYKTLDFAYSGDGMCERKLLLADDDPCLKKDYLLITRNDYSYGSITGIDLFDLETGGWAVEWRPDSFGRNMRINSMSYIGNGLLEFTIVNENDSCKTWVYDISKRSWLFKSVDDIDFDYYGDNLFFTVSDGSVQQFFFDVNERVAGEVVINYAVGEYTACNELNVHGRYEAQLCLDCWTLYDKVQNTVVDGPFDRLCLMYEQK